MSPHTPGTADSQLWHSSCNRSHTQVLQYVPMKVSHYVLYHTIGQGMYMYMYGHDILANISTPKGSL